MNIISKSQTSVVSMFQYNKKSDNQNKIETLPPEVMNIIIANLEDLPDRAHMMVCKDWKQLIDNEMHWKPIINFFSQSNPSINPQLIQNSKTELKNIIEKNINFQKN